jgi:transposase-like protein
MSAKRYPEEFKLAAVRQIVNACLEVHHSLRAKVHQFKTYF